MDDLISRKAAIDAMEQAKEQYFDRKVIIGKMQDIVNNLPSAQPVAKDINVPTNDCISRQDAIRVASGYCHPANIAKELAKLPSAQAEPSQVARDIATIIENEKDMRVIAAQPDLDEVYAHAETEAEARYHAERKKGKWINVRHDNIAECDQCGITGRAWMNFCFDCGADMRAERRNDEGD